MCLITFGTQNKNKNCHCGPALSNHVTQILPILSEYIYWPIGIITVIVQIVDRDEALLRKLHDQIIINIFKKSCLNGILSSRL